MMTECDDDEEETKDGGGGGGKRKQVHTSSANSGGGGGDSVDGGDNDGEGPAYDLPVFTVSSMDYQKLAGVRDVTLDGPSGWNTETRIAYLSQIWLKRTNVSASPRA